MIRGRSAIRERTLKSPFCKKNDPIIRRELLHRESNPFHEQESRAWRSWEYSSVRFLFCGIRDDRMLYNLSSKDMSVLCVLINKLSDTYGTSLRYRKIYTFFIKVCTSFLSQILIMKYFANYMISKLNFTFGVCKLLLMISVYAFDSDWFFDLFC